MRCEIEELDLSTKPVYQALSYSWAMDATSDASPCRTITLNGQRMNITQNLFEGLRRIRTETETVRLWVDAICINQKNDIERSEQVANMSTIYANAAATVIWLGESDEDDKDASEAALLSCLSCFGRAGSVEDHTSRRHSWRSMDGHPMGLCALRDPEIQRTLEKIDEKGPSQHDVLHRSIWEGVNLLTRFSNHRWFRRRWVVQEVLFSNPMSSTFYFGPYRLSLVDFGIAMKGLDWLMKLPGVTDLIESFEPNRVERIQRVMGVGERMLQMRNLSVTLPFLLQMCGEYSCSDPRDRLYSMISMDKSCKIRADYTLSLTQTYTMFARQQIEAGDANLVLYNARPERKESSMLKLPSWVPDLRFSFEALPPEWPCDEAGITVLEDSLLSYRPYLLGTVLSSRLDDRSSTILKLRLEALSESLQAEQVEFCLSVAHLRTTVETGDLVCSPTLPTGKDLFAVHLLRKVEANGPHQLVSSAIARASVGDKAELLTSRRVDVILA